RRISVIGTQAAVTILGAAIISYACWLGTYLGIQTVTLEEHISARRFVPAAINGFSLTFFLAGVATLLSSFDRFRSRTIGLMAAFFSVSLIIIIVGLVVKDLHWML